MKELSKEVLIELKNPATDFARKTRENLIAAERELSDAEDARRAARGVAAAAMLSALTIFALVFFYGCTFSASVGPYRAFEEAIDGGAEPIGYGMTRDLETEKE